MKKNCNLPSVQHYHFFNPYHPNPEKIDDFVIAGCNVHEYNPYMGDVGRLDQNLAAYMINLRSKKWWWLLFRFCMDVAINNAHQLYRIRQPNEGESRMDALEFCRVIVKTYYKSIKQEMILLHYIRNRQPRIMCE